MWTEDAEAAIRNKSFQDKNYLSLQQTQQVFISNRKLGPFFICLTKYFLLNLLQKLVQDQNLALTPEVIIFHPVLRFSSTGLLNTKLFCLSYCDLKVYSGKLSLHMSVLYISLDMCYL